MTLGYDDFKLNWNFSNGRVRCHGAFDYDITETGDLDRTINDSEYMMNKLYLWFAIKKGEMIGQPEIGCPIHSYFFKKFTKNNVYALQQELFYDLTNQLPELGVKTVVATPDTDMAHIDIVISTKEYGELFINAMQGDIMGIDIQDIFGAAFVGNFEV